MGLGTTVFCKISIRRGKNCLQLSIASGRLQIFRWPFPSCTIFVTYSNEFPAIFLSLIFRIWEPQVRLFFDLKVLWIAQKVHLGGNRRWLSLFIRFKQILTVERQTCKPDRYGSSRRRQESLRKIWKSTRIWKGSLKGFGSVRKPSAHFEWSQPTWGNGYRCWTWPRN